MKRGVVALLLACIAAFANAEGERMPRVAWVMIGTAEAGGPGVEALRAGLADEGFVVGRNVVLDLRRAAGRPERDAPLFAELTRAPADVLVAAGFHGIPAHAADRPADALRVRDQRARGARAGGDNPGHAAAACRGGDRMNKREFLVARALGAALPLQAGAAGGGVRTGPGLLNVTGAIARSNRGPLDPALDQRMVKHGSSMPACWPVCRP